MPASRAWISTFACLNPGSAEARTSAWEEARPGSAPDMTETPQASNDQPERATSVGETGGLPGRNATPQNSQLSEEEMADTVSGLGPADGAPTDEPETSPIGNG